MPAAPSKHVFQRHCNTAFPTAVAGDGCYLTDADGKRYLDACGGAAVSSLGHSAAPVIEAACEQLKRMAWAHTGFFASEPAEELAEMLAERAPEGVERVYFVSGGSEAVESAIKLARQYHLELGEPQRRHIIGRRQSYHGNTLGALAAGGDAQRRRPYAAMLPEAMSLIPPCHHYRFAEEGESEAAYAKRAAEALENEILAKGPDTVAAFIAEPVVGATMGAVAAARGYFGHIREICDRYGVLLILDEVMCGMGRTGSLFACAQEPVRPDIICIAKGLGAGVQPIGAMLCSEAIHEAVARGSGFFQHGHTYLGHPVACAAGVAVLKEIEARDLLPQVRTRGEDIRSALKARFGDHPNVGDIRGRGLFLGIELVADRATKAPLDPALNTASRFKAAAMRAGLMTFPGNGTIDGTRGDHIMLAPPFILTIAQVGEVIDKIDNALSETLEQSQPTQAAHRSVERRRFASSGPTQDRLQIFPGVRRKP